jgi:hypothetical protein
MWLSTTQNVAVNNTKECIVVMEMQQWTPFALLCCRSTNYSALLLATASINRYTVSVCKLAVANRHTNLIILQHIAACGLSGLTVLCHNVPHCATLCHMVSKRHEHDFRRKRYWTQNKRLNSRYSCYWNICHSKKNSPRYCFILLYIQIGLHVKYP